MSRSLAGMDRQLTARLEPQSFRKSLLSSELNEIKRRDLLGGLIHEYYQKAA
jgi:hypothetical protein